MLAFVQRSVRLYKSIAWQLMWYACRRFRHIGCARVTITAFAVLRIDYSILIYTSIGYCHS